MKIPCNGCKYNTNEDENNVWCNFLQFFGDGKTYCISKQSKVKNGFEIVPKSIFYKNDSTCAAKSI